ncbi:MAG: murein hydrolase activator EnvC family protein [Saprospiraceae bacterium]
MLFIWGLGLQSVSAQSRKELEEKRKELLEEINQTNTQLEKTKKDKEQALSRYFALQNQIQKRQKLVQTLHQEIKSADVTIEQLKQVRVTLNSDLERLKVEYASTLRTALRHRMGNSLALFLFSAKDFSDAFQRWQYIRQYYRYRNRQAEQILKTQKQLVQRAAELERVKGEKSKLLVAQKQQQSTLNVELADKDRLVKSLKTDETKLLTALNRQQKAHDQLNKAIEDIIRTEMAKKKKESRKPEALAAAKEDTRTAEDIELSGNFRQRRGKLPWPVTNGVVTRSFGTQPHPTLKGVKINNNGIDIRTEKASDVYAIFAGTVVGKQFVPGYQNMVIVQHGQYYSVYSNLEEVTVNRGDAIDAKQVIGRISNDRPEVHFEIWNEKQKMNPMEWINQ